jgi:hypothetical protein
MSVDASRLNRPLRHEPDVAIGMSVPDVIDQRLDALVARLDEIGYPTTRKDVVAALILHAPEDDEHLAVLPIRLRTSVVRDALMPGQKLLAPGRSRKPGPRRPERHCAS